eukprot:scaffold35865_cov169-Isochrysis_galbana.AAC.1
MGAGNTLVRMPRRGVQRPAGMLLYSEPFESAPCLRSSPLLSLSLSSVSASMFTSSDTPYSAEVKTPLRQSTT